MNTSLIYSLSLDYVISQAYSENKKVTWKQDHHALGDKMTEAKQMFLSWGAPKRSDVDILLFILWSGYIRHRAMKKYSEEPSAFQIITDNFEVIIVWKTE